MNLAGVEGFEPPHPVLETGGLPLNLHPFIRSLTRRVCLETALCLEPGIKRPFPALGSAFRFGPAVFPACAGSLLLSPLPEAETNRLTSPRGAECAADKTCNIFSAPAGR